MKIYDPPPFGAGINLVAGTTVVTGTASGILWNNAGVLAAGPNTTTATGSLALGGPAIDTAPVAQTLSVQNTLAGGTSNVAGANFTIAASQGKGTGAGGSIIIQVAPAGSSGSTVNNLVNALIFDSTKLATFGGNIAATTAGATLQVGNVAATSTYIGQFTSDQSGDTVVRSRNNTNNVASRAMFVANAAGNSWGVGMGATLFPTGNDFGIWLDPQGGNTMVMRLTTGGLVYTNSATQILGSKTTITGGATGNVPTLTAGPVTGNPTKWLPYDDNGTTRYVPSW